MFNIVLIEPQIPPNTGNIGRLCVNLGATLHLIEPLGFDISQKAVKRAGLDYWDKLKYKVWKNFREFEKENITKGNFYFATTKSDRLYWDISFEVGDYLIFGSETKGIDEDILKRYYQNSMTIPMGKDGRSLNLAVSVGIIAYEALRQNFDKISFEKIKIPFRS
ncbi:MAG: tRNA (cytidine(34)-2'-O)-methyltransferase [Epsilonproteobacteria bacterium]|nr:tRNA (cytidine(34)-2'-O)-methyltransferase [Campylobacterota bacterium]